MSDFLELIFDLLSGLLEAALEIWLGNLGNTPRNWLLLGIVILVIFGTIFWELR